MLLYKIFFLIFYIYFWIIYPYIYYIPALFLNNRIESSYHIRSIAQKISTVGFKYVFNTDLYFAESKQPILSNILKNNNLIDIIISNHISSLDITIITSYLNYLKINNFNYFAKKEMNYIPGLGLFTYFSLDIILNRKWDEDKHILNDQINKIIDNINENYCKHVIIIFPEGTRISNEKLLEGQTFSKLNNFPIYNNLLVPKTKGLYHTINYLKEKKRLGKIWDISLIIDKLNSRLSIFNNINGIYCIMREIKINSDNYNNPEIFKNYFLKYWKDKDYLLSNYNKFIYYKVPNDDKYLTFIKIILIISSICLFTNKYSIYFIILLILIFYKIIIFKIKI